MKLTVVALFSLLLNVLLANTLLAESIVLTGSNGRNVEFRAVLEARVAGLLLVTNNGNKELLVSWDKFNIDRIESDYPEIFKAYQDIQSGKAHSVKLSLGADLMDFNSWKQDFKDELNEKFSLSVPPMSAFYQHKDKDFMLTDMSEDKTAASRSKRFLKDYKSFLYEFFKMENPHLNKKYYNFRYYGKDAYHIVTEASPSQSRVNLTSMEILEFFIKDNKSKRKAIQYFNKYPDGLDRPLQILRGYTEVIDQERLLAKEAVLSNLSKDLSDSIQALEQFRTKKVLANENIRSLTKLYKHLNAKK